jgi:hypothetical protein
MTKSTANQAAPNALLRALSKSLITTSTAPRQTVTIPLTLKALLYFPGTGQQAVQQPQSKRQ